MSTDTDVSLTFELEEKVKQRIRAEILTCMNGYEPAVADPEGTKYPANMVADAMLSTVAMRICQYPNFVATVTKAVAQKLANAHIY
jgi:hypothetical protein